jgi:outer membrane protein assembly factor BamB
VYVGSTRGVLWALTPNGKRVYRHQTVSAIEAQPVIDSQRDELYALTVTGDIEALRASDGSPRWTATVGGTLTQSGLLRDDALYVVTEDEAVTAVARVDGSILWRYRREPRSGFSIAGHAGLTLAGRRLLAAFGDGSVVALDASDGRVLWETDTSIDLGEIEDSRRFVDVDTTPTIAGGLVYIASFLGGVYVLSLETGSVEQQLDEPGAVVDISVTRDALLLSSAESGLLCLNLPDLTPRWRRVVGRGAAVNARVEGDIAYVTESRGALLAVDLKNGRELGRIETGHGLSAPPTLDQGRGFVLSNAGRLFAFSYPSSAVRPPAPPFAL